MEERPQHTLCCIPTGWPEDGSDGVPDEAPDVVIAWISTLIRALISGSEAAAQQTTPMGCCHSHQGGLSPHSHHGYYGMQWASTACTQRESACREGAAIPMACSTKGLGVCRGAAAYPASSPGGVVSSKEGWGEHPPYGMVCTPCTPWYLHRHGCYHCYGVLRIPCRYPPWGLAEAIQGIYTPML